MTLRRVNYPVSVSVDADDAKADVANAITLNTRAKAALTSNQTYLAIASPSVAQNTAQTKALTRQVNGIIRLLLGQLDDVTDS